MKKTIVVVGSINLDLVASVQRLPAPGETVLGHNFSTYSGGKGANQAVGAARLGGEVVMVGRLGSDMFADQLNSSFEAESIHTNCIVRVPGPSGSAVILVSAEGANSIVVIPGANNSLQPDDLQIYAHELSRASIILAQLEIPLPTVEALAKLASEYGVPFMLDPAPACKLSRALLSKVTWLTPNENETQTLLNHLDIKIRADDSPAVAAKHLLETGARNVILKLGARGVFVAGEDIAFTHIPPIKVEPLDTTAAGDAFNGGFAFALSNGMAPIDAAYFRQRRSSYLGSQDLEPNLLCQLVTKWKLCLNSTARSGTYLGRISDEMLRLDIFNSIFRGDCNFESFVLFNWYSFSDDCSVALSCRTIVATAGVMSTASGLVASAMMQRSLKSSMDAPAIRSITST